MSEEVTSFIAADKIYEQGNFLKMIVSITFFSLHIVIALIETNLFIKDIGIGDQVISNGKLFYSLFSGYFSWFFRMLVSLLMLWLLLAVVRSSIIGLINVFRTTGNSTSAFANTIRGAASDTILYTLGMFLIQGSLMFFGAYAPYIFLMIMLSYCVLMYQREALQRMEEKQLTVRVINSLNTIHHHTLMVMTTLVISITVYLVIRYVKHFLELNPSSLD